MADRNQDGTLGELKQIIGDLPDGGQHPNRTLAVGPDGMLYITVGSLCNECNETNKEVATVTVGRMGTMRGNSTWPTTLPEASLTKHGPQRAAILF